MDNVFLKFCDCRDVIGNGPKCEIEKSFNNTDFQFIFLCVQGASQSWKKNIEIQFPKESIINIEENEIYVKGFVNKSLLSFEIYYFCEKPAKHILWWPRLSSTEKVITITSASIDSSKPIKVKDISAKCNFGINKRDSMIPYCDCTNVFGDGTYCEITLNRTSHYKCLLCLTEKSEAWKRNLETKFSNRSIHIIEEGENFVKGFIENHISFEVSYFCERYGKTIFPWPKQSRQSLKNKLPYSGNRNMTNVLYETTTVKVSDINSRNIFITVIVVIFVILIITLPILLWYYREENKKKYDPYSSPKNTIFRRSSIPSPEIIEDHQIESGPFLPNPSNIQLSELSRTPVTPLSETNGSESQDLITFPESKLYTEDRHIHSENEDDPLLTNQKDKG